MRSELWIPLMLFSYFANATLRDNGWNIWSDSEPRIYFYFFLSICAPRIGYAFPLWRLTSNIMEISSRWRIARLSVRYLYTLEEEEDDGRWTWTRVRCKRVCKRSCLQREVEICILHSAKRNDQPNYEARVKIVLSIPTKRNKCNIYRIASKRLS